MSTEQKLFSFIFVNACSFGMILYGCSSILLLIQSLAEALIYTCFNITSYSFD